MQGKVLYKQVFDISNLSTLDLMAWSLATTQIPESIEPYMSIIGYYIISKPFISSNISELFFAAKQYESTSLKRYTELGGGFKHFLFSPLLANDPI